MPTEISGLDAGSIDEAAKDLVVYLENTGEAGEVTYFDGWFGWGASAVLEAVVKRLRSPSGGWASSDTGTIGAFEKVIHIHFSRWQGKRGLQKAIAEELELPPQVMAIFNQRDEEDDFDGVEQNARGVIPQVRLAIMNELSARKFVVVFHNRSGNYIDLWEAGVPVIGQLSKRVFWTSHGRFWHHATESHDEAYDVKLAKLSDVVIVAFPSGIAELEEDAIRQAMRPILHAEAKEVAKCTGIPEPDMTPKIVMECILYMALRANNHYISWDSHASNYWVCDGIIQDATDGGRSAWEIGDALQRNVGLDICIECAELIHGVLMRDEHLQRRSDTWVSTTSQNSRRVHVPPHATSLFWTTAGPSSSDHNTTGRVLEASMFEHPDNMCSSLRVMHLSHCTFSFSSPPFLSCSNLRFLLLDHCKDKDAQDHSHIRQDGCTACFRNLWVLELSYTDWNWLISKDMLDLMINLRELNVKGVSNLSMSHLHRCSGASSNICMLQVVTESNNKDDETLKNNMDDGEGVGSGRNQQVSPPPVVASLFFPDLSSWHILKTVVLDGCGDLELIGCNTLPLSLESFTLTSNVAIKIKSISLRGCHKLNSVLLKGLFDSLVEIDMSGTAIKTLDLSSTQATSLRRLFLLGCEELCAILWPEKKIRMEVLCIDTTTTLAAWVRGEGKSNKQDATASDSKTSIGSSAAEVCGNDRAVDSYISLRDPRLFRSLVHIRHVKGLHVEISSAASGHKGTTHPSQGISSSGCGGDEQQVQQSVNLQKQKYASSLYGDDIISTFNSNKSQPDSAKRDLFEASTTTTWMWHCPPIPEDYDWAHCYISIQHHETQTKLLQAGSSTTTSKQGSRDTNLPPLVHKGAKTLHLHDSFSITCLPGPSPANLVKLGWPELEWCRLERCPNLEGTVFAPPYSKEDGHNVFQHLETFWASQVMKPLYIWDWRKPFVFRPGSDSFEHLTFLHLDYCPRLVHVLPLYPSNSNGCHRLETLEIVCCGNLREVFPSDGHSESQQQQEEEQPRVFPSLKRIHLYELPKLQRICWRRMLTPNLETVKIRGCWSLKRLPSVKPAPRPAADRHLPGISSQPRVDCEKDWWDGLEWDGEAAGHHPSHYKLTHSAYWNKTQVRTSVLR